MRSICFHPRTPSFSFSSSSTSRSSTSSPGTSAIDDAAAIVAKWNPDISTYAKVTSLFYEDKREARAFIDRLNRLQHAMHLLLSQDPTSDRLVYAQSLMQIGMKRLQKEFYQILSTNRAYLDPESLSLRSSRASVSTASSTTNLELDLDIEDNDTDTATATSTSTSISQVEQLSAAVMADLRSIADCMISSGYAKECFDIYRVIRKSIIDEAIYRLGVEKISASRITKMDWEVVDIKIKSWLHALGVATRTLFNGERILCDHVFGSCDAIRESCFAEISREGATLLFAFPELIASKTKKSSPERIFRLLDMYAALSESWPEIEFIFSFESTSAVRIQALTSLTQLRESARAALSDFESTIQNDSSKSLPPGGALHPLTIHAITHLSLLADYNKALTDIFADWSPPKSYFEVPDTGDSPARGASLRLASLILVLLCKLDGKAKNYKDVSLSYLFLANNLHHVVSRVRTTELRHILGEEWIGKHEYKLKQFAACYERMAWGKVLAALPESPTAPASEEEAEQRFRNFATSFEEACRKQFSFAVPDPKLRDEIKGSIAKNIVSVYREFYEANRATVEEERGLCVKFAPEDVGNYVSVLLGVPAVFSSPSRSSPSHRRYLWNR